MRLSLIFSSLLLVGLYASAQEHKTVLNAPEGWQNEIIPFPISFAPEIDLVGFEDLRFAPGWSDSTSQEFWSYTFVWYVEPTEPLSVNQLTEYFNLYYDGLMGVDLKNKNNDGSSHLLDKAVCHFTKTHRGFTGTMRVHDAFFTREYISLNIKVSELYCEEENMKVFSCDISPQPFDSEVWDIFNQVELTIKCE